MQDPITKIALVDNHDSFRHYIKQILNDLGCFQIIAEARDPFDILPKASSFAGATLLISATQPITESLETANLFKSSTHDLKVALLMTADIGTDVSQLIRAGVHGCIAKSSSKEFLVAAIKCVSMGNYCFSGERMSNHSLMFHAGKIEKLTRFEWEVLQLLTDGKSSTEIAVLIHRSARTVEDYRKKLYDKFKVNNKEQLISKYTEMRMLSLLEVDER